MSEQISEKKIRGCIDRIVPAAYLQKAQEVAERENPANRPRPFEAAAVTLKLWKPGRTLHIRFLDGDPVVQKKVKEYAHQWREYANIHFVFDNAEDAEIRISFLDDGSWSALGTDALVEEYFPKDEPTMNYGWLTPASTEVDYSRVVLHEFGHSLGMIHEHQNPAAASGIRWNKEAVYRALAGSPNFWDRSTVDHNVFETYDRTLTQFTQFDSQSIMLYAFPAEWTLDGRSLQENDTLSGIDKLFIAARYPHDVDTMHGAAP
jgi:Matrixin